MTAPQKIPLIFFRTLKGVEPVRDWLKAMPTPERQCVGKDLLKAQWRWPVGMPLCRPLGDGLWEIRTDLPTNRTAEVPEGVNAMSKKNMGSSIDAFLKEEGVFEQAQNEAVKEVVAWQLVQAMKEKTISKNRMATLLKTSRTQVDRLLDANNDITLSSLERAAAMVGRRVSIQLV